MDRIMSGRMPMRPTASPLTAFARAQKGEQGKQNQCQAILEAMGRREDAKNFLHSSQLGGKIGVAAHAHPA